MKAYWMSGGTAPFILDLGTIWRWVVSFTSWLLYPKRKSCWYPWDRRLGGPQSLSGHSGEEKNSQPPLGLEPPILQPIAQHCTTDLKLLSICVSYVERDFQLKKFSRNLEMW